MRKPTICMGENKDADQLRGNREADQRLCFRYTDSTFPPLLIPKFSRFWVSSVTVQAGLCWTWSEIQIVGFVMHRLNWNHNLIFHRAATVSVKLEDNASGKHVRAMNTPLNPTFINRKTQVCMGIPIFLIFAPKHRLCVLVRTASQRRF